jgi:tetratricopeptide (TPR) repeat protein
VRPGTTPDRPAIRRPNRRPSKLSAIAARCVESSWLAALVVVPLFFNMQSVRVFEADKIFLLRSLAVLIAVGLIVRGCEEGRRAWTVAGQPLWNAPLVKPMLLLTGAYIVSTAFSIAPRVSWLGAYDRVQGTYTWLGYVTIFLAIILLVREPTQRERIVTTILLASFPVAIYAVMQHFGYDPIAWRSDVVSRPYGSAGNAIFLGAFLIMVAPLTLARTIERLTRSRPIGFGPTLVGGAYAVLLAVQLLAIVYSNSRGPFIGLAAGLTFFALVFAARRRLRRLSVAIIALAVMVAVFVVVLNIPQGPLQPLRDMRYFKRLATMSQADSTGWVRAVVWQGAAALLAADPVRDLVGYGPDALFLIYPRFYPAELAHFEGYEVGMDRCHNETFDALTMTGVLGCAAEFVLYVSVFSLLLRQLGLIGGRRDRRIFLSTTAAGGGLGAVLPCLVDGSFRFSGIGLPVGIVVGVAVYVLACALGKRETAPQSRSDLLLIGLLAAVIAHVVEIQLGIAVSMTRLLFWVYAGLAVSIGPRSDRSPQPQTVTSPAAPTEPWSTERTLGLIVALICFVLAVDFCRGGLDPRATALLLLSLLAATWLFGAVIAISASWSRPGSYALASAVPWVLLAIAYVFWWTWPRGDDDLNLEVVLSSTAHLANSVPALYLAVFGLIALMTVAGVQQDWRFSEPVARRPRWRLGAYAALLLAAAPLILFTNLQPSRADVFSKRVAAYTERNQFEAARAVGEAALRLQPETDRYAIDLSAILMKLARGASRAAPQQRTALLTQALSTLQGAQRNAPLNPDLARNLARLHRAQAEAVDNPGDRTHHFEEAQQYYQQAAQLNPHNVNLLNEWAQLYIERFQLDKASALVERSLRVDDQYASTYWLRGNIHVAGLRFADALADYERATAIAPKFVDAWRAKAMVLKGLQRFEEAIAAENQVQVLAPGDLKSLRDLTYLYEQTGQFDRALAQARRVLATPGGHDRLAQEQLIERLEKQAAAMPSVGNAP